MLKLNKLVGGVAAAAILAASAFALDFGPAPSNFEADAKDYISSRLEDPRGARFQFRGEPYQVYADLGSYDALPAWAVDVRVKARLDGGSFGGYVSYTVIFIDGDAVALEDDADELVRL